MKRIFVIPLLVLAMLLSACGATTTTPESADSISSVYTVAAATLAAQAPLSTPTPGVTVRVDPSPTSLASATLLPSATNTLALAGNTVLVGSSGSACDNSAFLSDVTIPDGTILAPGQSFTKTWSVSNAGTCAWSTSYSLDFFSGDVMSGSAVALSAAVASGGSATVSISMVAPTTVGTYTGYWKLKNASGAAFGQAVYVQIVVSSSAATLTPISTSTDSATSTLTATIESASTSTSTLTPSSTPQPSQTPAPTASPVSTETPDT